MYVRACVRVCMREYTGELALSHWLVAVCIMPGSLSNVLHMWCKGVGLVHNFELPFYIYIHRVHTNKLSCAMIKRVDHLEWLKLECFLCLL